MRSLALSEFPYEIQRLQLQVLEWSRYVQALQDELDSIETGIEMFVAWDPQITEETQREARRLQLHHQDPYLSTRLQLQSASHQLQAAQIELQLRTNQFTVAQIQARAHVAYLESAISA
ncbi:MAG: hypothetical protein NW237_09640 [Cyanobacteriota bacterium]|nr:hypothetical protein [Cyanobacteriota bacterium]